MTTKTKKLPDGMQVLLDRVGMDTKTARLCASHDWVAAKEWVDYVLGMQPVMTLVLDDKDKPTGEMEPTGELEHGAFSFLERREGEVRPTRQSATNQPRADAYEALSSMLEGLSDG